MSLARNLLLVLLILSGAVHAGSLTTSQIVERTGDAALACMRWMPVGVCFWLRCSLSGCKVKASLKVGHYQPDAVVASYNELGGHPWVEIRSVLGLVQETAASGLLGGLLNVPPGSSGNRTGSLKEYRTLVFREVDVIGHPLGSLSGIVASAGYLCRTQTTAYVPYFQSALDALAWRMGVPEMLYPQSLVPGLREIGAWPVQTWGSVYPRGGWVLQAEEPKAAAILAQRAADIVTRTHQPHVYVPMTGGSSSGQKIWRPGPLLEDDPDTGEWQMLLPRPESSCGLFGTNDLASVSGWGGGRIDPGGDYAWTLWRPYSCCRDRGSFLFEVRWTRYPP